MNSNNTADKNNPDEHGSIVSNEQPHPDQMKLPGGSSKNKKVSFSTNSKLRLLAKGLIILLIIALIGSVIYFGWRYFADNSSNSSSTAQLSEPATTDTSQPDIDELTEEYSSPALRIDFKHPNTWTVKEGAGGIRVESSEFTYDTVEGEQTEGYFRLYIRKGARDVDSKYIGRGVAIKPSEELSYTNPAPGQREDTNLSFFGLDVPDNFAFIMIAGNFSLKKGDTLGPDYAKEPGAYIIAGGYTSEDLSEDLATNKVPIESYINSSAYLEAIEVIKSIQLR